MGNYYLAVDIGASSGRHILAELKNAGWSLRRSTGSRTACRREMARFWLGTMSICSGEIKNGLKKCKELGENSPVCLSGYLGRGFCASGSGRPRAGGHGWLSRQPDPGNDRKSGNIISQEELYKRTGVHWQLYNTIYQLEAIKETHPEYLEAAESILMTPDYFHFLLSGEKHMEYTIASTSQLVSAASGDWDWELLDLLGFPRKYSGRCLCLERWPDICGKEVQDSRALRDLTAKSCCLPLTIPAPPCWRFRPKEKMWSTSAPAPGH